MCNLTISLANSAANGCTKAFAWCIHPKLGKLLNNVNNLMVCCFHSTNSITINRAVKQTEQLELVSTSAQDILESSFV